MPNFRDFISFKVMLTNKLIEGIFIAGSILLLLISLMSLLSALQKGFGAFFIAIFAVPFAFILSFVFWRIFCEFIILIFKIHEQLVSIDKKLDNQNGENSSL